MAMTEKTLTRIKAFRKPTTITILFCISVGTTFIPILASGFNPLSVYYFMLYGAIGSLKSIAISLNETTPLLFCSLGLVIAFRCGVWNIGAEGQLYMGALGATIVGLFLRDIPTPLHLLLVFVASFIGGGLWGGIAGFLRVRYSVNEIICTLLMNFIAYWIIVYLVHSPLRGASAFNPVTNYIAETARLPIIFPGTVLHAGILIGLALSFVVWFVLQRTVLGYRIKAVGSNPEASLYAGIPVHRIMVVSMILSGGIAGLAGMGQVAGVHYLLMQKMSFSYGYFGILVALLGRLNPFGVIPSSLFLGILLTGGHFVQATLGIPNTIAFLIIGIIILVSLLESSIEKLFS